MTELHSEQLAFFPLPFSRGGRQSDGCLTKSPPKCGSCELRECEVLADDVTNACRFGFNFVRLDAGTVINGFLLDAEQNPTKAWLKNPFPAVLSSLEQCQQSRITRSDLQRRSA